MAPSTKGFEDKQDLNALNVQLDRNSGSPTRGNPHGDGASIVLVGVTTHQGVRENLTQGEGKQVLQRVKEKGRREMRETNSILGLIHEKREKTL